MNTISCCIAHTHLAQLRECPTTSGPRVRHSLVISFLQSRHHLKDVVAVLGTIFLVPIVVLRRFMPLA